MKLRSILAGMQTLNSATPVDIDARESIQTDGLHERLCDLGDIPIGDDKKSHDLLKKVTRQINHIGACAILLGGSNQMSDYSPEFTTLKVKKCNLEVFCEMKMIFI